MLSTLDRNLERWALLIFYMMLVVTMAIEVIRREVFAYSSVWGEEIVRYAFIYLAWIGAAAAVRERAHIRIDVIMHYVGPRTKAALYIFGDLVALAVPVWAAIGSAAIVMLMWSGALPLSLVGESLFDGIDAFALTTVPLFILTGDALVRTGLSRKFLNVAEALTQFAKGGFGSATVLVCGMFSAISGSDAAGAAAVGRMTIDRLVESGYPRPYACALASGWYAFIVPGIIFYGIFSGRLTPTEAGATAVVVTVILGFVLGTLRLADFPAMLISSAKVNGVILPIIAFSLPLAQALAIMGGPQGFVTAVTGLTEEPAVLILLMILILIAAGCVMETMPNIVILAPILKPLADNIGMNEIQFCVMMITALGVGFITPPLGLNLFVVSGITGESILRIAWRAVPFVFFMLIVVLLIAYIPAISTTMLPGIYK